LPDNKVRSITIDGSGNKWIGTGGGLAKFDGTNWTVYNTSNSGLPDNKVRSITIDGSGNKWIGTGGGLAKFDGTNWTVYNTSNSGLPHNIVNSLVIDGRGNKWIGTGKWTDFMEPRNGGLAVYNEGGVVSVEENPTIRGTIPKEYLLSQNFPNPFNPSTKIKYSIPKLSFVTIKIYDVLGGEVATLVNEEKQTGTYEITWYAEGLPSGVYFYKLQAGSFVETKKMVLIK
jgi:hypothetical protein